MTPSQAIVAATKNGAIASRGLADFGTIEAGKRADLLLLGADPLADIHNIRNISKLIKDGKVVDRATLAAGARAEPHAVVTLKRWPMSMGHDMSTVTLYAATPCGHSARS